MKKLFIVLVFVFGFSPCFSQTNEENQNLTDVISLDFGSRFFGSGDFIGIYFGGDYNKQFSKHFAYGLEATYAIVNDDPIPSNLPIEPPTIDRDDYTQRIRHFRISPHLQYVPLNKETVDLYLQVGPQFGIYNDESYFVGYTIVTNTITGDRYLRDINPRREDIEGERLYLGYDFGLGANFDFNKFRLSPDFNFGYELEGGSFANVGIQLGLFLN